MKPRSTFRQHKSIRFPVIAAGVLIGAILAPTAAFGGEAGGVWYQNYAPFQGSLLVSSLLALTPVVVMFGLLALKKPAHISALSALAVTMMLAIIVWKMPPVLALSSTTMGMMMAVFPILWTLASAVWIFNMLVDSGYFEVVKKSLGYVTHDRRLQTVLIGFGFTTLLESLAAFGAPIAIVGAMLAGLGFPPLMAAVIVLLADTHPSAWGTQGMPVVILSSVTDLDINALTAIIGSQTPVVSALCPALLVLVMSGWKGLKGVWPITVAVGLAYGIVAAIVASFIGPYVVGIAAALAAILTTLLILHYWRPGETWLLPNDDPATESRHSGAKASAGEVIRAWSPYVLLVAVIGLVNGTGLKHWLSAISTVSIEWPGLHNMVYKTAPVVARPEAYQAVYQQPLLLVGGSLVFFAGVLAAISLGIKPNRAAVIYGKTVKQLLFPGLTIISILGIAYLMNYSAMTYTIGLAFASTGFWFPMATTFLGALGCTLAGSVAASNALFGNLSVVAGEQIGVDPALSAGTLASGGTMGKAITPQNLVIATGALGLAGREADLLKRVWLASLVLATIIGAVSMLQQHVF